MLGKRTRGLGRFAVAAVTLLASAGAVSADHDGYDKLPLHTPQNRRAYVIVPDWPDTKIVTKYSYDHPPAPDVVPVQLMHQTQYIRLHGEYLRQGHYRIDDNHWILQSQRLAKAHYGGHAQVIYAALPVAMDDAVEVVSIQPRLIIQRPGHLPPNNIKPDTHKSPRKPGQWVRAD
jgi:hypothetical protein